MIFFFLFVCQVEVSDIILVVTNATPKKQPICRLKFEIAKNFQINKKYN